MDAYRRGDDATAVKLWRPLAEQGIAYAQYSLGVMYAEGWGVQRDHAEAVKWYRKAADQYHADAKFNLGGMYYYGEGVPQDRAEAVKIWGQLAERGHAAARANLRFLKADAKGLPRDKFGLARSVLPFRPDAGATNTFDLRDPPLPLRPYDSSREIDIPVDSVRPDVWDWDNTVALIVLGGPIVVAVIGFLARRRIAVWWWTRRKGFRIRIFVSVSWAMGTVLYFWVFDPGYFIWEDVWSLLPMMTVPPLFLGVVWFGYTKLVR
jgi:TPR repeat protein